MASIFKPAGAKKWVFEYTDETGRRRKKTGCTDKAETKRIADKIENRVALRKDGLVDPKDEKYRDEGVRSLSEHLADWQKNLLDKGKTAKHAAQYVERAGKLMALVHGATLSELQPGRKPDALEKAAKLLEDTLLRARFDILTSESIQSALADLRDGGLSHQTVNHYRAALRAFCRWAKKKKRVRENPMEDVEALAEQDPERPRRSLTDAELGRLIHAAQTGPVRFGMPGPLRAMAYRVAAATGFRVQELRSLTPQSFRLNSAKPTIFLRRSSTKNRKPADQPIPQALATDLAAWLPTLPSGESVFPLHHETAKAIRADLEAIGVPYETDDGVADFHSLRAYYVSALVRSGANVTEFQNLARHAKADTTLKHYAKVARHDLCGVVEALPSPALSSEEAEDVVLAATGTDPALTTTQDTTDNGSNDANQYSDSTSENTLRFAKPLRVSQPFGGSNPPLSAEYTSGRAHKRQNASKQGTGRRSSSDVVGRALRTEAHRIAPVRPPGTTENTTGQVPYDPALASVVSAWPTLPEAIRAGILAMVQAARPAKR